MTTFPGSPRLIKGGGIGIEPFNPLANVVVFQYNPDTLTYTQQRQDSDENDDHKRKM